MSCRNGVRSQGSGSLHGLMDCRAFAAHGGIRCWIAARVHGLITGMLKLITLLAAAIPVLMFLRTIFGRSKVMRQASAEFRKQVDYLVWGILILIGGALVYSAGTLIASIYR